MVARILVAYLVVESWLVVVGTDLEAAAGLQIAGTEQRVPRVRELQVA